MKINYKKIFSLEDAHPLYIKEYSIENPKAVVLIVHGMQEHQERYTPFATELCNAGYNVMSFDLRGHGKSITDQKDLGFFGATKGWQNLISDTIQVTNEIKNTNPNLKLYVFAHSLGSLIVRAFMQDNDSLFDKVVLSGAPSYNGLTHVTKLLIRIQSLFLGRKHKSKFFNNIIISQFNKSIKNPKTKLDWLSYNKENLNYYITSPDCGFIFCNSAYADVFSLNILMHKHKLYQTSKEDLPILFVSGVDDSCTGFEKGVNDSINTLRRAGYTHIESKIYNNARHELLNEDINNHVIHDIINFLDK